MQSVQLTTIKIGSKLNLTKVIEKESDENKPKRTYVSQILNIDDDDEIMRVAMPIYNGKLVPLGLNDCYDIVFYTEKGLFTCIGKIIQRYKENNIYVLVIELQNKIVKHQRRQFYRLECSFDFLYRLDTDAQEEEEDDPNTQNDEDTTWFIARTLNISGGGIRFISEQELAPEDNIVVRLSLDVSGESKMVDSIAKVITTRRLSDKKHEIRVEFGELSKEVRDLIVKFIFEEERRIRRREAGLG